MNTLLVQSTLETLLMVIVATLVGCLLGVPLGVSLFVTRKGGLCSNKYLHQFLSFFINSLRSLPYVILMVGIMPLTRMLTGTTIGTLGATVPLSFASILLIARITDDAFKTLPRGLTEAALAMGASQWQVVKKVLFPESLPPFISGLTLVVVNLIGFSAMAGTVGGGGLGDLAMRYGYQRYDLKIMLQVILILIIFVQLIQTGSEALIKKLKK